MYYEIRGFMKKKIVFLQPKIFEINFRLWSLTAAFYTLCYTPGFRYAVLKCYIFFSGLAVCNRVYREEQSILALTAVHEAQ